MKNNTLLGILLIFCIQLNGQNKADLGRVTIDELKQSAHPTDSDAKAAMLFNIGRVEFNYDGEKGFYMTFYVKAKIKIYKKEGYDKANVVREFYVGGKTGEGLVFKNAVTYNLVDGKIEKTKVKSENIFEENINKFWSKKKLAFPNVREGSILEYEYELTTTQLGTIDEWMFQSDIPVDFSELTTLIPEYFTYSVHQRGYLFPTITRDNMKKKIQTSAVTMDMSNSNGYNRDYYGFEFNENITKYTLRNVPAIREESYVNNVVNYVSAVEHELASISFPQEAIKTYSSSWESVVNRIYMNESFGGELAKTDYFENDLAALNAGKTSQKEKIISIFQFVKNKVKWNGFYGYSCNVGVRKAYKEQSGNAAEVNLILTAMLRKSGIIANPVLISTRSNGIKKFPGLNAFNFVITGIQTEEGLLLLDATDPYSLPNLLPIRDLNWYGRIIRQDGSSSEVFLMPEYLSVQSYAALATLTEDGIFEGKEKIQWYDYNALLFRNKYANLAVESYLEKLESDYKSVEFSGYEVEGVMELNKPIVQKLSFKDAGSVETIGNKIYFSPLLFLKNSSNPFVSEKREYPVDFNFPNEVTRMITINLPEGYQIESIPSSKSFSLKDDLIKFTYNINGTDNRIQVSCILQINTSIIGPENYQDLKTLYDEMTKTENEKIVLKKL